MQPVRGFTIQGFVGGRGGYSKCVESFINEFSPNMVKYSLED